MRIEIDMNNKNLVLAAICQTAVFGWHNHDVNDDCAARDIADVCNISFVKMYRRYIDQIYRTTDLIDIIKEHRRELLAANFQSRDLCYPPTWMIEEFNK